MAFKPIEGLVNVGGKYYAISQGMLYCWENNDGSAGGWDKDLGDFVQSLRLFNVRPYQIDNMGTENIYYTERLKDAALEKVLHGLERPIVRVLKKYVSGKMTEEKTGFDHSYLIEVGDSSFKCELEDVSAILSELECRRDEVLFHEEIPEGYDGLNKTEKLYIQSFTYFDRRELLN